MKTIRTILVDDSPEFLALVSEHLAAAGGFEIAATATAGEQAVKLACELAPDLVLLDLMMPGMNGIEASRRITAGAKAPVVIMLTLHDNQEYRQAARGAGADGFVAKSLLRTELVPCIFSCLKTRKHFAKPGPTPKPNRRMPAAWHDT